MSLISLEIPKDKKIYFASDFHLGTPDYTSSIERERKIIQWMDSIKHSAHTVFLVGDLFDFWFEYKSVIPKGFVRFQAKIAEFTDEGIPVTFFTGNHDVWMFDYFQKELGVSVVRNPKQYLFNGKKFYIGHGDGLGPGDYRYKLLRKIFNNRVCQWLFARLHPNLGVAIANRWSKKSRISSYKKEIATSHKEEWLLTYSKQIESKEHHDYYVFGHRHLPLDMEVSDNSRYINLGEWINYFSYGEFDGDNFKLSKFDSE